MPFFKKIGDFVREQDLFSVPVSLTYGGQTSFNTIYGGCVSLSMIIGLTVYFCITVRQLYVNPEYQAYPRRYDFSDSDAFIRPDLGNTVIMSFDQDNRLFD